MFSLGPTSDAFPGMPEVLISSEMDSIIVTSSGVKTDDVVGMVKFVKIGEDIGNETDGSDVLIKLIYGSGGIDYTVIDEVMGKVDIGNVGGLNGGGVVRFRNGCFMILSKTLDLGSKEGVEKIPLEMSQDLEVRKCERYLPHHFGKWYPPEFLVLYSLLIVLEELEMEISVSELLRNIDLL